eukprot:5155984-Prymnesium_polylepis.1
MPVLVHCSPYDTVCVDVWQGPVLRARSVCVLRVYGDGGVRGRADDATVPRACVTGLRGRLCVCYGPTGRGTRTGH